MKCFDLFYVRVNIKLEILIATVWMLLKWKKFRTNLNSKLIYFSAIANIKIYLEIARRVFVGREIDTRVK